MDRERRDCDRTGVGPPLDAGTLAWRRYWRRDCREDHRGQGGPRSLRHASESDDRPDGSGRTSTYGAIQRCAGRSVWRQPVGRGHLHSADRGPARHRRNGSQSESRLQQPGGDGARRTGLGARRAITHSPVSEEQGPGRPRASGHDGSERCGRGYLSRRQAAFRAEQQPRNVQARTGRPQHDHQGLRSCARSGRPSTPDRRLVQDRHEDRRDALLRAASADTRPIGDLPGGGVGARTRHGLVGQLLRSPLQLRHDQFWERRALRHGNRLYRSCVHELVRHGGGNGPLRPRDIRARAAP